MYILALFDDSLEGSLALVLSLPILKGVQHEEDKVYWKQQSTSQFQKITKLKLQLISNTKTAKLELKGIDS